MLIRIIPFVIFHMTWLDFIDLCPQLVRFVFMMYYCIRSCLHTHKINFTLHHYSLLILLSRFLIGLNSPKNLSIMNASVTSIDGSGSSRCWDVTDTMNKLKTRNNSIYVLNFKSDLGVSVQKGTLRLRAQFDDNDDDGFEEVIPFNVDTEYLLCDL